MSAAAIPVAALPTQLEQALPDLGVDPLLLGGIALGIVLLLLVAWLVIRRFRRSPGERLRRQLATMTDVSVLMHPNPDPDAMACALAVGSLAADVDTRTTLQYPGQIRHQENRAFETVLDVSFDRIEVATDLVGEGVVLVDHNTPRGFTGAEGVAADVVVDHHPGGGEGDAFTDVRPDVGACASIFAEYFEDLGWEPVPPEEWSDDAEDDRRLSPAVSTGLLYGIQSDTDDLTKGCTSQEFRAASYLYPGIDQDALDRIANPEVDAEVLDVKARAINDRVVRNAFAVSDVGPVSNVDAIPQAADELRQLEGVTAVIVFGANDGTVHVSGRSRDDRVHMGKTLRTAVADIPMADAGGHARMGGGQLSLEHLEGLGPSQGFTREEFVDRLFDAMNGEL